MAVRRGLHRDGDYHILVGEQMSEETYDVALMEERNRDLVAALGRASFGESLVSVRVIATYDDGNVLDFTGYVEGVPVYRRSESKQSGHASAAGFLAFGLLCTGWMLGMFLLGRWSVQS